MVCEREYNTTINGEVRPILVQWMQPRPDEHHWRCDFTIAWPEGPERHSYAMGVDSAQALILALFTAGSELQTGRWPVQWFDDPVNVLGLPELPGDLRRIP